MTVQSQRAGANSKQIIVAGDLNENLTLDEATEVAELVAHKVVAEHFAKADALGLVRIDKLNERVLNRLEALDKLAAFADPAFQVLLRKAQIGAASTERDGDYDMLTELLTQRVLRGEERPIRAGIDRAVQIVDQIDVPALTGLTVLQAANQFGPMSGKVAAGLDAVESLFAQFPMDELPIGTEWLDHLDILDAVRINTIVQLKRFEEYFPEAHMMGYLAPGVETESLQQILSQPDAAILAQAIVSHELKDGFSRLGFPGLIMLEQKLEQLGGQFDVESVLRVARDTFGLGQVDAELKPRLMEMLDAKPNLHKLHSWWNEIPYAVLVTAAGRVLATANAKRCDIAGVLPPLD